MIQPEFELDQFARPIRAQCLDVMRILPILAVLARGRVCGIEKETFEGREGVSTKNGERLSKGSETWAKSQMVLERSTPHQFTGESR